VETLAEHVAMLILEEFGIAWVGIVLSKPGAVRGSATWVWRWSAIDPVSRNGAPHRAAPLEFDFMTGGIIRDEPLSGGGWLQSRKAALKFVGRFTPARRGRAWAGRVHRRKGIRAYGINTGVGGLSDVVVNQRNCAICRATSS